ncbi:hypothetical protein [Cryptosporangium sp. NPDC051539]|uniref:hypothetical protein n=1 Tax=Cryptosporangium sp. NPDC051539 TaxID=3363962 RepID=UPI00379D4422
MHDRVAAPTYDAQSPPVARATSSPGEDEPIRVTLHVVSSSHGQVEVSGLLGAIDRIDARGCGAAIVASDSDIRTTDHYRVTRIDLRLGDLLLRPAVARALRELADDPASAAKIAAAGRALQTAARSAGPAPSGARGTHAQADVRPAYHVSIHGAHQATRASRSSVNATHVYDVRADVPLALLLAGNAALARALAVAVVERPPGAATNRFPSEAVGEGRHLTGWQVLGHASVTSPFDRATLTSAWGRATVTGAQVMAVGDHIDVTQSADFDLARPSMVDFPRASTEFHARSGLRTPSAPPSRAATPPSFLDVGHRGAGTRNPTSSPASAPGPFG